MAEPKAPSTLVLTLGGFTLMLLGAVGGWLVESRRTEQVVKDTILANPEILPQAMEKLRQRETQKQIASVGDRIEAGFPGAVLGNPAGKITLVEFTDFACTYCRASVAEVDSLIRDNPDLKVVVRQLPILSQQSAEAARWSLAAAEQGKYAQFHAAMFAAGRPDAQTIAAAAKVAGLDLNRARQFIGDPRVNAELSGNIEMARQLGFEGTPSWVVGDQALAGAVGREVLNKAIAAARESDS